MSTSLQDTRAQSLQAPADQTIPRWRQRNLSPTRGLIYLGVFLAVILGTLANADAVWGLVAHAVILLLEIAEELLDTFLEVVGMAPGAAQMITAYIGVLVFVVLMYFLARKYKGWTLRIKESFRDYRDMYIHLLWVDGRAQFTAWWQALDWPAKIAAAAFGVLILIPVLLALSVGLGALVASVI